jgi:hypothetical protein
LNEYKEIKDKVKKLGKNIDPGYRSVLDTMENIG